MIKLKKGKSVPRTILDAGYNLINDKYDVDSINVKILGLRLPNNETKDINKVIR